MTTAHHLTHLQARCKRFGRAYDLVSTLTDDNCTISYDTDINVYVIIHNDKVSIIDARTYELYKSNDASMHTTQKMVNSVNMIINYSIACVVAVSIFIHVVFTKMGD